MHLFDDSAVPSSAIELARNGDRAAREAIYRAFAVPVHTLARRILVRAAAAEDIAQDVFVEVFRKLPQYDARGSFAGWVRTIAVNRCLMHLRSPIHRCVSWLEAFGAEGDPPADERQAQGSLEPVHLDLERALARLPPTGRLVVWLHDVEGYTHSEIGALLGGTPSLSKSQLARAHERLRELLEPPGAVDPCMHVSRTTS